MQCLLLQLFCDNFRAPNSLVSLRRQDSILSSWFRARVCKIHLVLNFAFSDLKRWVQLKPHLLTMATSLTKVHLLQNRHKGFLLVFDKTITCSERQKFFSIPLAWVNYLFICSAKKPKVKIRSFLIHFFHVNRVLAETRRKKNQNAQHHFLYFDDNLRILNTSLQLDFPQQQFSV